MTEKSLTQESLKEILHYCPETGVFKRIKRTTNRVNIGDIAGTTYTTKSNKRYINININGVIYGAHRLVWLYIYGEIPKEEIDHIDGNGLNNSLKNLRDVSKAINCRNVRVSTANTSGVMGVSWHKLRNKWRANIKLNQQFIHLGLFDYFNDAVIARKMAEYEYGFHPNHGNQK